MIMNAEEIAKRGIEYQNAGDLANAVKCFEQAIRVDPANAMSHYSLSVISFNQLQYRKALAYANRAIESKRDVNFFYETRARIHNELGLKEDAILDELKAASLGAGINTAVQSNRIYEIVKSQPAAFFIKADIFETLEVTVAVCEALGAQGRIEEAIYVYRRYIATNRADRFVAHFNLAALYSGLGDDHAARGSLEKVIQLAPVFIAGYLNLGTVLEKLELTSEAIEIWEKGKQLNSAAQNFDIETHIKLLNNLGRLSEILRNYETAEAYLYESLKLDGTQDGPLQHWIHLRQKQCKWPVLTDDAFCQKPLEEMASPLSILSLTDNPAIQLACSKKFARTRIEKYPRRVPKNLRYNHERIRIGYASSDLSMHAVSLLTVEMFELHDRSKFDVHAFCWSPEDGTAFRQRVKSAFDHFHPIGKLTDDEAADLIQSLEIDVLVDLQGLSGRARPNLIAQGAAPIQISYLGYPGTSAIPYLDYVIGDEFIFPESLQPNFTESAIRLPTVFQVSDSKRQLGALKTKQDYGFSDDEFVFCCFNNNYKYNERIFSVWIEILNATKNTILWLLDDNKWLKENLQKFAAQRGVELDRIKFSERIDPRDYLARFKCADLFLDTYPYNAGTTANDVLWAGLPLLTLSGTTYVSRMAGSLSKCMGLDEQICYSIEDYRNKAIYFAKNPDKLKQLRNRVSENYYGLFDIQKIVSDFETGVEKLRIAVSAK